MEYLYYDTNTEIISQPKKITLDLNCNGITVKNIGNSIVIVDGNPLLPLEALNIGGNKGEIYTGRHNISFQPNPAVVVPEIDLAVIVQKFYVAAPLQACNIKSVVV
jgi:hypothetical protein